MRRSPVILPVLPLLPLLFLATVSTPAKDGLDKTKIQPAVPIRGPAAANAIAIRGAVANPLTLLRNPAVQQELQLDEAKKGKIQEAYDGYRAATRELFKGLRGLQPAQRQQKFAQVQKQVQAKSEQAKKAARAALKPDQAKRLDQILLQQSGLRALGDDAVVKQLEITERQQKQIRDIEEQTRQQRMKLSQDVRNGNVARQNYQAKLDELEESSEKQTLEILTPEQRTKFDELKGAQFELPRPRLVQAVPLRARIQIRPANGQQIPAAPRQNGQ